MAQSQDVKKKSAAKSFKKIGSGRSFEAVVKQIRDQIASGELKENDRLPAERELALQFGVSRNTVREALRSLENSGLVSLKKGVSGGAFICIRPGKFVTGAFSDLFRLGILNAEQLTEARVIVGVEVARLACARITESDIAALQENLEKSRTLSEAGDLRNKAYANLEFHEILAAATGNPVLIIMTDALGALIREFINVLGAMPNPYVLDAHELIIRHLRNGDGDAVAAEMKEYLERVHRRYLDKPGAL
ncbi:FadR/GntR family transcriptional regulator [Advenella kashmirensis]